MWLWKGGDDVAVWHWCQNMVVLNQEFWWSESFLVIFFLWVSGCGRMMMWRPDVCQFPQERCVGWPVKLWELFFMFREEWPFSLPLLSHCQHNFFTWQMYGGGSFEHSDSIKIHLILNETPRFCAPQDSFCTVHGSLPNINLSFSRRSGRGRPKKNETHQVTSPQGEPKKNSQSLLPFFTLTLICVGSKIKPPPQETISLFCTIRLSFSQFQLYLFLFVTSFPWPHTLIDASVHAGTTIRRRRRGRARDVVVGTTSTIIATTFLVYVVIGKRWEQW